MKATRPRGGAVCRSLLRPLVLGKGYHERRLDLRLLSTAAASAVQRRPEKFWFDINNQREFLEKVSKELEINQISDWYKVYKKDIVSRGGAGLFNHYGSVESALRTIYPGVEWDSAAFIENCRAPRGHWRNPESRRKRLDKIGSQLGITKFEDWYNVSRRDVLAKGGSGVLSCYTSLEAAVIDLYPEYPWDSSKFMSSNKNPPGYWKDTNNVKKALDWAEKQLGITKPEDWYTVTLADLIQLGFSRKIKKPQLAQLLNEKYPDYDWERVFLLKGRYAQQKRLERVVNALFGGQDIKINVRKEAAVINPSTGDYLELDIYIPSLNLAFEFQEKHHYVTTSVNTTPEIIKARDKMKQELVKEKGISLVVVPCWWDGTQESLVATIRKKRPDLLADVPVSGASVIPDEPPEGFFDEVIETIEDIGEPTNASFFTLSSVDPAKWWIFEKYDGMRGFWNPLKKAFYSRKGNKLPIPQFIVDTMPGDLFLDGELWFGRENFQEALKIAHRKESSDIAWDRFKFMVFDVPNHKGTYKERYELLDKYFGENKPQYIDVAPKEECRDINHLEEFFQNVIDVGGEGVILRDPNAPLQPGRSPAYLKHKKFRDGEAKIIGSTNPFEWECELPNGVRFTAVAGTKEFSKRWSPKSGDIVSFKHHGYLLASRKPKLPTLYRLRPDLTWEDVVNNWKEQKSTPTVAPLRKKKKNKPKGYWASAENRRKGFCEIAELLGFDPMVAENWTNIPASKLKDAIINSKKGLGLSHFKGSIKKALVHTFPELKFNFPPGYKSKGYWQDVNNCRTFFDEFAQERGFDPLDPENWYELRSIELGDKKGGFTMLREHGTFRKALIKAYPELSFDRWVKSKAQ